MRRSISTRLRVDIFARSGGVCGICNARIQVGDAWDVEHRIPLALGGEDGGDNLYPAHRACHASKTKDDFGRIAKAKRQEAQHLGARVSRSPLPFGRGSQWKRKMDGSVVRRDA